MLKNILKEIDKNKQMASTELETVEWNVKASVEGQVRRAKENLKNLFYDYKNALKSKVIFILVNGKGSKKFADTAAKNYAGFSYNAEDFYKEIVDQVDTANYIGRKLSNSTVDILSSVLQEKALEVGISGYPALLYREKYSTLLNSKEDLVDAFKNMLNEEVGAEFVGLTLLDKAAVEAANQRFSGDRLAIVIYSQDSGLLNSLSKDFNKMLTPNVFTVTAGIASKEVSEKSLTSISGKIDKDSVGTALKEVMKNLR